MCPWSWAPDPPMPEGTWAGSRAGLFKGGISWPGAKARPYQAAGTLPPELRPQSGKEILLRAVPGPQDDYLDEGLEVFFQLNLQGQRQGRPDGLPPGGAGYLPQGGRAKVHHLRALTAGRGPDSPGRAADHPPGGADRGRFTSSRPRWLARISPGWPRPGRGIRSDSKGIDLDKAHALYREAGERMNRIRAALE